MTWDESAASAVRKSGAKGRYRHLLRESLYTDAAGMRARELLLELPIILPSQHAEYAKLRRDTP